MSVKLKDKQESASEAIDAVFGDTTVSRQETKDALEELAAQIEMKLQCLKDDAEREELC